MRQARDRNRLVSEFQAACQRLVEEKVLPDERELMDAHEGPCEFEELDVTEEQHRNAANVQL